MMLKTFAFIDASNIIYGTRDERWKVDLKKSGDYEHRRLTFYKHILP